jgi:hypothetical protein
LLSTAVKNKNAMRFEGYQTAWRIVNHEELIKIMTFSNKNVNENNGQTIREMDREQSGLELVS